MTPAASVRYRRSAGRGIAPLADVHVPARPSGASVVLVHGGGFVIGSRRMRPMRYLAARLVASGVAVCAVDYRMIFRGGRLDEAVDDVGQACEFWRADAARRGLDAGAISLVGLSAGGALALLAAGRDPRVHRVVSCFGLYDLDLPGPRRLLPRLLLRTADRATWRARSPLRAPQPAAPTLLLHGSADGLVSAEQARRLAAHREALRLPTRLVIYPGAPHAFFTRPHAVADAAFGEILDHLGRGIRSLARVTVTCSPAGT